MSMNERCSIAHLDMVLEKFSPMLEATELGTPPRPGSPAVCLLRIESMP